MHDLNNPSLKKQIELNKKISQLDNEILKLKDLVADLSSSNLSLKNYLEETDNNSIDNS